MAAEITAFFHADTSTYSYVLADPVTREAAIIDPVLDYEPAAARVDSHSVERLLAFTAAQGLAVRHVLETHVHADHLSAAHLIRERTGASIGIGAQVAEVQAHFAGLYGLPPETFVGGRPFDLLFADGDRLKVGNLDIEVMHTPGHTPACVSYRVEDAVFVGDTLFMPDYGTARCDFPGGDAAVLYASIQRLFALPDETRVFLCHDYPPAKRTPQHLSTVGRQRRGNVHVHEGIDQDTFVAARNARDANLAAPRLILPALQVNIHAGALPTADDNGIAYLRLPLNQL
ncbi:MAG: MBL fold metallo-hydrolase [Pseudomonadota bacterium]|nr:MBL fold metallo-hydrolase [Pseudomonadota bacterium]